VPPVILLPPSEGKAPGGRGRPWQAARHAFPELHDARRQVRDAARAALAEGPAAAERLLGVRGDGLARALADWERLDRAPTRPAAARYTGVVWAALDPAGLDAAGRRRLRERALVVSGLWGLVAAGDPLPPYRLRMGARVPGLGGLAAWWRPRVSAALARRAGRRWIVDLLPREHAAAIDPAALGPARLVRVELVDEGRRAIGHDGKALKGRLARAILLAGARTPAELAALEVPDLALVDVAGDGRGTPALVTFARRR
jgi:cytoplasmic iron level regulating protein YaaA (DUF328/UPF0246 family)